MALTRAGRRSLLFLWQGKEMKHVHPATGFCAGIPGAKLSARPMPTVWARAATGGAGGSNRQPEKGPEWVSWMVTNSEIFLEMCNKMSAALRQYEAGVPSTVKDQLRDLLYRYGHLSEVTSSSQKKVSKILQHVLEEALRLSDVERLKESKNLLEKTLRGKKNIEGDLEHVLEELAKVVKATKKAESKLGAYTASIRSLQETTQQRIDGVLRLGMCVGCLRGAPRGCLAEGISSLLHRRMDCGSGCRNGLCPAASTFGASARIHPAD